MNPHKKIAITLVFITAIFLPTVVSIAQTRSPSQVNQRFNPNVTLGGGGNTFGGLSFSGVGGAIAACTGVGDKISRGLNSAMSSLGNSFSSGSGSGGPGGIASGAAQALGVGGIAGGDVPVTDKPLTEQEKKEDRRESCLNGVAYAVAKNLLQQVTNKTINWVNTGFGGNPLYVRDINSYFKTISDQQISRFLKQVPSDNPIFGNAIRSIVTERVTGVRDGYLNRAMNTPEGRAYQDFQEDFKSGGWSALLNPANNPIDALFDASEELASRIENEQEIVSNELERNNGFLDLKKCVEWSTPDDGQMYSAPECLRTETVTPGSAISATVNEVTTTTVRQLEQADQINEVLGSFFDQLLNKLFTAGLGGIRGRGSGGSFSFVGAGSNVVIGSNGLPIATGSGQDILGYQSSSSNGFVTNDFDVSRPQQLRAVLKAQYDYLNRAQDARVAMNRIVPALGALDYCIPGPNPTWQTGFSDNANTYFTSLIEVQPASNRLQQLLQGIPVISVLFGVGQTHTIAASEVQLFDKAIGGPVQITDTAFREPNRSTLAIWENVQRRFSEVVSFYNANYTKEKIKEAFVSVDNSNSSFVSGFVDTAFIETAKLPSYDQGIGAIDSDYSTSISDVQNAIAELESIRAEANAIVATAKARYITERASAGTPVNLTCINDAYKIDSSPIVPVVRQESNNPSPFLAPSLDGANTFYSRL